MAADADAGTSEVDLTFARDGALTKRVLQSGSGDCMAWGAQVETRIEAWVVHADGEERPLSLPETFSIEADKGVLPGILIGVQSMQCGETAAFTLGPQFLFEPSSKLPPLPPNARLRATITLLSFANPDTPVEKHITLWSPFEKLCECQREKEEGNALFKAGDYTEAIKHYHKAKGVLTWTYKYTEAEKARWNHEIGIPSMLNLAACHLRLQQWQPCIDFCHDVLEIQPANTKALFRRGQAHAGLEEYGQAIKDLQEAADLDPTDSGIQKELARVKKCEAASLREDCHKWGRLFRSAETKDYLRSKEHG
eukprot:GGOE01014286.1.p1 GENE.GGOE01014286.1~~GGOE01014286.1.p1  ORF type:complete len:332 (-),score=93.08 GGOE01014286.1:188-1114(-)